MATATSTHTPPEYFVLEDLPGGVREAMAARDAWFKSLPMTSGGEEFLVSDVQAWRPGQVLRVAFMGGTTDLHRDIAEAVQQITQACNIHLDFGFDAATGKYRAWSTTDTTYAAEIRVSFDLGGYWSLVGTDCINENIGGAGDAAGGRPNQRSLNLGGFHVSRPARWKGTARHEFMHALAFHHEHQNLNGPCQHDFRWEDDAGYVTTQDDRDVYLADAMGRRPGIYTYLSGAPNRWDKAKIDFNLRAQSNAGLKASAFDNASVMLYRFPALFYNSPASLCAPSTDGENLSAGDIAGLQLLYPAAGAPTPNAVARVGELETLLQPAASSGPDLESMAMVEAPAHPQAAAALRILRLARRQVQ